MLTFVNNNEKVEKVEACMIKLSQDYDNFLCIGFDDLDYAGFQNLDSYIPGKVFVEDHIVYVTDIDIVPKVMGSIYEYKIHEFLKNNKNLSDPILCDERITITIVGRDDNKESTYACIDNTSRNNNTNTVPYTAYTQMRPMFDPR